MDEYATTSVSRHKRGESISFIRLIRSNRNDETLKRVCQHLSVLVAIENSSPRPKSRNDEDLDDDTLHPPNNTPVESVAPHPSKVYINRGKENWNRISSIVLRELRVVNAFKKYRRERDHTGFVHITIDIPEDVINETALLPESSSLSSISRTVSSIVTIDQLVEEVLSMSAISKIVNFDQHSKHRQRARLCDLLPEVVEETNLGRSIWSYFKRSTGHGSQEEPSGVIKSNSTSAKSRWHILSRTILTLVRVVNLLHLFKRSNEPEQSASSSLGSVTFIKKPDHYNDSVSSGSFSSASENSPNTYVSSGTDNSYMSNLTEGN